MRKAFAYLLLIMIPIGGWSQSLLDSATVDLSLYTSVASDYQPFWFAANRDGVIAENQQNLVGAAELYVPYQINKNWRVEAGVQLLMRNSRSNPYAHDTNFGLIPNQYYGSIAYRGLSLNIGAYTDRHSIINNNLTTGDWGVSRNARPIPKISIGFDDYVDVPYTNEWVKVKGAYAHGWMEQDRFVPNPSLHEKYLHIKILEPWIVNFEFGLTHYALFGGDLDSVDTSVSAGDYWNIVTGSEAPGVASGNFVPGSHLGTLDLAMNFSLADRNVKVYVQKPWEDSQQIGFQKFFAKYWDNQDNLIGLHITNPVKKKWLQHLVIEYMHSKLQTGPGLSDVPGGGNPSELDPDGTIYNQGYPYFQRENYYNNWFYGSGWTHYGRTVGTPLFLTSPRMRDIYDDVEFGLDYERTFIFNNRVEGLHVGASGQISDKLNYEARFTYTRNFGNYYSQYGRFWERLGEDFHFEEGRTHYYLMTTVNYQIDSRLNTQVSLGYDFGDQNSTFGLMGRLTYRIKGAN
ncbi:MAG: capsule assembly Wzi family protein [Bacteroidota bacterium]